MKLFLLDAYALIYRAYYGLIKNPRINSKGQNTSAIFGFVNTLEEILTKEQPTHLGVAFDPHGGTFRHKAYPLYKAQREETPEAIRFGVPLIKDILQAYHIPILEVEGYEADDVIGTLAHQADAQGIDTFMMTPDKDYGQLVTERVRIFKPRTMKVGYDILGPAEVCAKWGIQQPAQVVDILGLMGDASDNIPGCTGVGEKTAATLIQQFGSIEAMLQQTHQIKGKLREKVEAQRDQIVLSRWLAQIVTDVPIHLDLDALAIHEPDTDTLSHLFGELEMWTLVRRTFANVQNAEAEGPSRKGSKEPRKSRSSRNSNDDGQLDLFADYDDAGSPRSPEVQEFKKSENPATPTLARQVQVAHYLLHPDMSHSLAYLQQNYLTADDSDPLPHLLSLFETQLREQDMWTLYHDIEVPLMDVLHGMEETGVCIDTEALRATNALFTQQMLDLEHEIHTLAGCEFNIQSPRQVGEVLFDRLHLTAKAKKTASGAYSTNEEVLQKLQSLHPIVGKILAYRGKRKLISTYLDTLPRLIHPDTGRIHTTFNQTVTATGRLSSTAPNLQNIPVRDDDGREIRRAFIPEPGCLFFSADYSQIELRIMAHLSGDEGLIADFLAGHDIHAATAAKIYHKDIAEVTREERSHAKTANFGIIYGITAFGLTQRLGISRSEAAALIDEYFQTYPRVRAYMQESIDRARQQGYTQTIMNRRCYLRDINSANATVRGLAERNAINAPIQGSAADIIKKAMVAIDRRFRDAGLRSRMILQVHDELNFNVVPSERDTVQDIVLHEMQNACTLRVPLIADCGWGHNWLEAH